MPFLLFLNETFLGINTDVWKIILVPLIIVVFEFLKSVWKKAKKTIASNNTVNIYPKNKQEDNENQPKISQKQLNDTVRVILKEHLNRFKEKFEVDRVYIVKFHNGNELNETYPGNVFQVASIIEESLNTGVSSEMIHLKDIPTTFYKSIFDEVLNTGKIIIDDVEDIKNSDIKFVLRNYGVSSLAGVGIFDDNDDMVGIIFIEYVGKQQNINREDVEQLIHTAPFLTDHIKKFKINKGEH